MSAFDPRSLHAKRDPSDPEDAVPYPGDNRDYPTLQPSQMSPQDLAGWAEYHAQMTGATCTCGWCAYFEGRG